jgi:hypothetical protein
MDIAAYGQRLAQTYESIQASMARFAATEGFEDADHAFDTMNTRDVELKRLFELEAVASFMGRLADKFAVPMPDEPEPAKTTRSRK